MKKFTVPFLLVLFALIATGFWIFDTNITFTSHTVGVDSIVYFCIQEKDGDIDTLISLDTLGNIVFLGDVNYTDIEISGYGNFQGADSLAISLWNNHPANASNGAIGLDTAGTDTLWIKTEDGWAIITYGIP